MSKPVVHKTLAVLVVLLLSGCSAKIAGVVNLMDMNDVALEGVSAEGAVINMISLDAPLNKASHSVLAGRNGSFSSAGSKLEKGRYKVEVIMPGFVTNTMDVELGSASDELVVNLKKIPTRNRRSYRNSGSDSDKIVNPGEVNIQPPSM